jgi:acyl carrier protein
MREILGALELELRLVALGQPYLVALQVGERLAGLDALSLLDHDARDDAVRRSDLDHAAARLQARHRDQAVAPRRRLLLRGGGSSRPGLRRKPHASASHTNATPARRGRLTAASIAFRSRCAPLALAIASARSLMTTESDGAALSQDEIEKQLVALFAGELGLPPERVDAQAPIAGFGVDSVGVASLIGDVERMLGRRVDPALLWQRPSIAGLARHLASAEPQSPRTAPAQETPEMVELRARLQELEDEGIGIRSCAASTAWAARPSKRPAARWSTSRRTTTWAWPAIPP